MYIESLKNCGLKEEFTYLDPKMPNNDDNKLDMNKENTNCNNQVIVVELSSFNRGQSEGSQFNSYYTEV